MNEHALCFGCAGETLVGVLSRPADGVPASGCAVLIIVGGPQYRAGAHRQFVQLARALAAAGHVVLRFDYRGMGDSSGEQRNFEAVSDDIGCAIDSLLAQAPRAEKLVLFGLCDAASAALLYLHDTADSRVHGLCLLNPWARSDTTLARTHLKHYYVRRLTDRLFWRRLLRGEVGLGRVGELLQSMRQALRPGTGGPTTAAATAASRPPFQAAMALAWRRFPVRILLVLCGADLTAREFVEHSASAADWRGALQLPQVQRLDLPDADHTLSEPAARQAFEAAMCHWLSAGGNA